MTQEKHININDFFPGIPDEAEKFKIKHYKEEHTREKWWVLFREFIKHTGVPVSETTDKKDEVERAWLASNSDRILFTGNNVYGGLGDKLTILEQLDANMIRVPDGVFRMGSNNYSTESPAHHVTIRAFYMLATPVTQAQYQAVMGNNPSYFRGDNYPVESVSWHDAKKFCLKLSELTGVKYRLPSEAEWEYACRAGSTEEFCFGSDARKLEEYAWYTNNSGDMTHPVGKKKANNFGLSDMHGNVWEWVEDKWCDNYQSAPVDRDTLIKSHLMAHVLRGGSWASSDPLNLRTACRFGNYASCRDYDVGFRCSRDE